MALPAITLSVAARDFEVGEPQIGLALSAYTVGMALSSVPAGLLGDRFGPTKVLAAFFWLLAAAALGCAFAPTYGLLLIAHSLLGLSAGLFHPAGLSLVSLSVEPSRLGRAMGSFGLIGGLGWFSVPLLMNTGMGWRTGFQVIAAASALGAVVTHVMVARGLVQWGTTEHGSTPEGSAGATTPGASPGRAPAPASLAGTGRARIILLVSLLAAMGINAFSMDGFLVMFPETVNSLGTWIVEEHVLIASVMAVGALGQYVGGFLARDQFAASRYAVLLVLQPLTLFSLAQSLGEPAWPFMLMGSFAFLNFMTQPIENKLLAVYTSARRRATAFAFKFVVALLVASPAAVLVATLFAEERWGFPAIYRVLSSVGMLGVIAGYAFLRLSRLAGRPSRS